MKSIWLMSLSLGLFLTANVHAAENDEFDLSTLIAKAIGYHPSIKSNLFLEDSANQDVRTAQWQYFPTPALSVNGVNSSDTDPSYNGDDHAVTFSLSQPIWTGGALTAGLKKSRANLLSAQETTKVAKRELALEVINAYSQWYASHLKKESYQKSKDEHLALLGRIERRIEQGLSSRSDLDLVNSRLSQAEASLNSAIIEHENSLLNLAELLGVSLRVENLIRDFTTLEFSGDKERLSRNALLIDPTIKQLKAESLGVKAELAQSRTDFHPRVNLRLERQWGNLSFADVGPENRVFLEVSSSFGAGLSHFSKRNTIENRYRSLQVRIQDEQYKIKKQIELDWMSSASLKRQESLLESSLVSIEKIRDSWYRQFLAGRKTWQDVMNSTREASQLEAQLADAHASKMLVDWRLLVRVQGVEAIVNPYANSSDPLHQENKALWYPTIASDSNAQQQKIEKLLDFVTPNEDDEKVIWHSNIERKSLSPASIKKSFIEFMDAFDKEYSNENPSPVQSTGDPANEE